MKFPDCFPENFEKDILPSGAREQNLTVYRVIKCGILDETAFLSTYQERLLRVRPGKKVGSSNLNDAGAYSTSCFLEYEEMKQVLLVTMRNPPAAFIAKGITCKKCGPSQITKERNLSCQNSHVDWWIYKGATPHRFFKQCKDENQ